MRSIISASSPKGRRPCGAPGLEDGVEHVERVVGLDGDLEAEVAGVAGARQRDRRRADLGLGVLEERAATSASGISAASTARERGPWTASMP